jgi:hypothetical protein
MVYDKDKVDEMVLALLYLTSSHDEYGTRAWKGLDMNVIRRLYEKGYINEPDRNSPTLSLTETGGKLSKQLFFKLFNARD